jgi:hypothetical protein
MEQQVFHTLLGTGYLHVDDLDCLDLPPAAFEVRGTLVNRVRAKGWMERSGAERKVAHKAANARKAPIYRITAKGRHELPTLVGKEGDGPSVDVPGSDPGRSLLPGEEDTRASGPPDQNGAASSPSPCAGVDQGSSEGVVASSLSEEPARLPGFEESSYERLRDREAA